MHTSTGTDIQRYRKRQWGFSKPKFPIRKRGSLKAQYVNTTVRRPNLALIFCQGLLRRGDGGKLPLILARGGEFFAPWGII